MIKWPHLYLYTVSWVYGIFESCDSSSPLYSDLCEDQPMGASRCTRTRGLPHGSSKSRRCPFHLETKWVGLHSTVQCNVQCTLHFIQHCCTALVSEWCWEFRDLPYKGFFGAAQLAETTFGQKFLIDKWRFFLG